MQFQWPLMLWLLLSVPACVAWYVFILKRRRRDAVYYSNVGLIKLAGPSSSSWRRHVPPALLVLSLLVSLLSAARPVYVMPVPTLQKLVVLAVDISGSMRADDVKPTRMGAVKQAAKSFVEGAARSTRIGVVAFSEAALMVQSPTREKADVLRALDTLEPDAATAIGRALLVSLHAIFPAHEFAEHHQDDGEFNAAEQDIAKSSVIILLSDGQSTAGIEPAVAAKRARMAGVRVYTVGVGTEKGVVLHHNGYSQRVGFDVRGLRDIAALTEGDFYMAGSAAELRAVYKRLSTSLVTEVREEEVTAYFAALAALLMACGAVLSLVWHGRVL